MPDWPAGWQRTASPKRARFDKELTIYRATLDIQDEARRLKATGLRIDSDLRMRKDGMPYSQQRNPEDAGVVVYFTLPGGRQVALACDAWDRVEHNLRAIAKTMEAKRGIERWGCATGDREYEGYLRLPSSTTDGQSPHEILGVKPDASEAAVRLAFRKRALEAHPDRGGSPAEYLDVVAARDALLNQGVGD